MILYFSRFVNKRSGKIALQSCILYFFLWPISVFFIPYNKEHDRYRYCHKLRSNARIPYSVKSPYQRHYKHRRTLEKKRSQERDKCRCKSVVESGKKSRTIYRHSRKKEGICVDIDFDTANIAADEMKMTAELFFSRLFSSSLLPAP